MQVSQQLAAQVVGQVLDGRNLSVLLETLFQHHRDITPQQRATSQDLAYGTLRFYARLEALLQQLLQKPLSDAFVHHLLLVILYQLAYDKAGAHTVVNQAVLAAAKTRKAWPRDWSTPSCANAILWNSGSPITKLPDTPIRNGGSTSSGNNTLNIGSSCWKQATSIRP